MTKIAISPNVSGTGTFTLAAPDSNTDRTLTLPDAAGEVFNQGNILGTVSQSGGVPTGAVIEIGSNANGEFVRFADGTQICTRTVTGVDVNLAANNVFRSETIDVSYSAEFAAIPSGAGSMGSTIFGWVNGRAAGLTSWTGLAWASVSRTGDSVQLIAIGRWY